MVVLLGTIDFGLETWRAVNVDGEGGEGAVVVVESAFKRSAARQCTGDVVGERLRVTVIGNETFADEEASRLAEVGQLLLVQIVVVAVVVGRLR